MAGSDKPRAQRADALRNRAHLIDVAGQAFGQGEIDLSLDHLAQLAGVGIGTVYRHFPTRDALVEAVYRSQVARLAEAGHELSRSQQPIKALRSWMLLFVDYIAAKKLIAPALSGLIDGGATVSAASGETITNTMQKLADAAVAARQLDPELDPIDLLRALFGVATAAANPGWADNAKRLVDILIAGSQPRTLD